MKIILMIYTLCNLFVSDEFQVFNGHMMLVAPVLDSASSASTSANFAFLVFLKVLWLRTYTNKPPSMHLQLQEIR